MRPLALLVLFGGAAEARRAGVPVADLAPPGATLTSVTAPLAPGLPARLVYGDSLDVNNPKAAVPIGITCRLCERMDCEQRAFPPMHRRLGVDENVRGRSFYTPPPPGGTA